MPQRISTRVDLTDTKSGSKIMTVFGVSPQKIECRKELCQTTHGLLFLIELGSWNCGCRQIIPQYGHVRWTWAVKFLEDLVGGSGWFFLDIQKLETNLPDLPRHENGLRHCKMQQFTRKWIGYSQNATIHQKNWLLFPKGLVTDGRWNPPHLSKPIPRFLAKNDGHMQTRPHCDRSSSQAITQTNFSHNQEVSCFFFTCWLLRVVSYIHAL